jgi:hypothetical protein
VTLPVSEWARRAATLPAALVAATPPAVRAGAGKLETEARENLRRASGGDLRLSRVRSGKGARVDVKVSTQGSGSGTRALVLPVGPVSLVEGDTRRHREPFTYSGTAGAGGRRRYATAGQRTATGGLARRRRARGGRRVMVIPGVGVRAYVQHPGTSGRHPVGSAMRTAGVAAGRAGAAVFALAVAEHLTS